MQKKDVYKPITGGVIFLSSHIQGVGYKVDLATATQDQLKALYDAGIQVVVKISDDEVQQK